MLIDTFTNSIYLYDGKIVIGFNYKEGTKTITFDDVQKTLSEAENGLDLDCLGAPILPTKTEKPVGCSTNQHGEGHDGVQAILRHFDCFCISFNACSPT